MGNINWRNKERGGVGALLGLHASRLLRSLKHDTLVRIHTMYNAPHSHFIFSLDELFVAPCISLCSCSALLKCISALVLFELKS